MIAHLLTLVRLLLAAPVAWALARPDVAAGPWLLVGVGAAIATDLLDGPVARRWGRASPRGRLFDHTADFVFVGAGLGGASAAGAVPALLPVLVALAFTQYVVDSYWLHRQRQLRMSVLGRWNGILYFVPLVLVALSRVELLSPLRPAWALAATALSYALVVSTAASMVDRAIAPALREGGAAAG